jgi:2-polyprenyl-6-methoxyphenol hydroxylase-like FAD-dependent oxidoreductase
MTNPPRRVVIVGASFAGLFAAAAIARAGAEVTLLERDRLTDRGEPRPSRRAFSRTSCYTAAC